MENSNTQKMIDELVFKARNALSQYMKMSQADIDKIVEAMALAAVENHVVFSEKAVSETGRGLIDDKIIKNMFAAEYIYNSMKHRKTVGIIDKNDEENYIKDQYFLEVSSPGVERVLRKEKHLEKNIGTEISVKLFKKDENGKKEYQGILKKFDENQIKIQDEENQKELGIERKNIAQIKTIYHW